MDERGSVVKLERTSVLPGGGFKISGKTARPAQRLSLSARKDEDRKGGQADLQPK